MARVNIEDKWWMDPRREQLGILLGSLTLADGVAVKFWRVSQDYWKTKKVGIPANIFRHIPYSDEFLSCSLAVQKDDFFYVLGSEEHHQWLIAKKEAGKRGGLKSQGNFSSKPKQTEPSSSSSISYSKRKEEEEAAAASHIGKEIGSMSTDYPDSISRVNFELLKHGVQPKTAHRWVEKYQDAEWIVDEILKALEWNYSQPIAKQKKSFGLFITNWLERGIENKKPKFKREIIRGKMPSEY